VHDRGLHLPGRVRSVRWHRRARAGCLPRPAAPAVVRSVLPHQARQRSGRQRPRLQDPSRLRRPGGSVGEGLRLDQRHARGDHVLVGPSPPRRWRSRVTSRRRFSIDSTKVDAALWRPSRTSSTAPTDRRPAPAAARRGHRAGHRHGRDQRRSASAANQPTFVAATGVITLPAVAGVQWQVNGVNRAAGAQPALAPGAEATVNAVATPGNNLRRRRMDVRASVVVLDRAVVTPR
jgi:hypothetical protein